MDEKSISVGSGRAGVGVQRDVLGHKKAIYQQLLYIGLSEDLGGVHNCLGVFSP